MCQAGKVVPGPLQELSSLESAENWGRRAHLAIHWAAAVINSPCLCRALRKMRLVQRVEKPNTLSLLSVYWEWEQLAGPGLELASLILVWERWSPWAGCQATPGGLPVF